MMPPPPAAEEWSVVPMRKYSSFPFSITSRQALETVVGSTQASRVIPELSCRELLFGIVTRLLVPLKESALPYFPGRRPGRACDRARVAVTRRVGDRRPGALLEAVRRDEP